MEIDRKEFQKGLVETRKYLLSHHEQPNWDRCYTLSIFSWEIRICARCLGIYLGIPIGLITYSVFPIGFSKFILLGVLPLPALFDWTLTSFTNYEGYNITRTMTGILLGYGYSIGLVELLVLDDVRVLLLGVVYVLATGILLWYNGDLD